MITLLLDRALDRERNPMPQFDNIVITMPTQDFEKDHCVYFHTLVTSNGPRVMYVGICKLREVMAFPDARANSEWKKYFTPETRVFMHIVFTSPDINECYNHRYKLIKEHQPYCNMYGHSGIVSSRIACVETGQEFNTAAEACRTLGLNSSALSNHLNGKPGFKTVKGKTFTRLDN